MKKPAFLVLLLLLTGAAWASSSLSYFSAPAGFSLGGGRVLSTSYQADITAGIISSGTMTGTGYVSLAGLFPILTLAGSVDSSAATGEVKMATGLVYPNPFNPANGPARLAYQLNGDTEITLYLINEVGQLVWRRSYAAGGNGGKNGYNEISWDGTTDFNETAGNGAYFLRLVADGKVIGKIKIAILK